MAGHLTQYNTRMFRLVGTNGTSYVRLIIPKDKVYTGAELGAAVLAEAELSGCLPQEPLVVSDAGDNEPHDDNMYWVISKGEHHELVR